MFKKFISFAAMILATSSSFASESESPGQAPGNAGAACDINYEFNARERAAFNEFKLKLQQVDVALGKSQYQKRLVKTVMAFQPSAPLIDYSPNFKSDGSTFFDFKIGVLIEQKNLEDLIARTIGLSHPAWLSFAIDLRRVNTAQVLFPGTLDAKQFAAKTKDLITAVQSSRASNEDAELNRSRAIAKIVQMQVATLELSAINQEFRDQRFNKTLGQAKVGSGVVAGGAVLIGTVLFSGPILATAGLAGALATDAVVAASLAKTGEILAGALIGTIGAPSAILVKDSTKSLMEAYAKSANDRTVYTCELDHQLKEWRNRGVSPYIRASIMGATIGLGGGTLTTLGAVSQKAVLYATNFGVHVAALYSLGKLGLETMESLGEYQLALEAISSKSGNLEENRALAIEHLKKSREFAALAGETGIETVIVGILSFELAKEFPHALHEGEKVIRAMFASSTDTLPTSVSILKNITLSAMGSDQQQNH